jgi:hypothetical protein
MKTYPTISREIVGQPIYAFDKLDGNNIRAEWTRKQGFCKFGSRKRLVGEDDLLLGKAQQLVLDKYGDDLARIFREQRWQKAIAFFEYHGPNSFAGLHDPNDELTVTLFDVAADKKGILEPRDFLKIFKNINTAPLLHHGNPNSDFVAEVKEGKLEGMTFEGVVCKGKTVTPGRPLMFKVKNQAWLDKLKTHCGANDSLFKELV